MDEDDSIAVECRLNEVVGLLHRDVTEGEDGQRTAAGTCRVSLFAPTFNCANETELQLLRHHKK